jgi:hypothetical protein
LRQTHQLGGQQQDISQKNTIQPQLIGDFFAKFHFSLVVARLAGILVEGIKNRKAEEIFSHSKRSLKYIKTFETSLCIYL